MEHPVETSKPAPSDPSAVGAFFDVDNTLIPGTAIEVHFFRFLWKHGLVGWSEAARSVWHLLRHIPPMSFHPLRARKRYLEGKQPATIEPVAEAFVQAEVCPRLSQVGLAKLDAHRRDGHRLVLITASLDFLITPLARHLGVEAVLAARPERTSDGYTGRVLPPLPYGEGKRVLLEAFAKAHGLDLRACYAYGDSPGDVETLRLVGHPQVVNPIRGMARIAQRQGWPVVRWT
ncbi:MAG: HAD family hydrolase [Nitrospiraceae bacterium]